MMLSKSVFCVLSGVKVTLKKPKIYLKIFNLKAFAPFYSWAKLSRISSKNNAKLTLGFGNLSNVDEVMLISNVSD